MAPEVIAALVGIPAVLVTAAAAYAAGRAQARSAYQGPVDSVRRQHQRDAYARLLTAVHEFEKAAYTAVAARGEPGELFAGVEAAEESYWHAEAVVSLEGPTELLRPVDEIRARLGTAVLRVHQFLFPREGDTADRDPATRALGQLSEALGAFTTAARTHLNGRA